MSWLKELAYRVLKIGGTEQAARKALNFVAGSGLTIEATDDAENSTMTCTFSAPALVGAMRGIVIGAQGANDLLDLVEDYPRNDYFFTVFCDNADGLALTLPSVDDWGGPGTPVFIEARLGAITLTGPIEETTIQKGDGCVITCDRAGVTYDWRYLVRPRSNQAQQPFRNVRAGGGNPLCNVAPDFADAFTSLANAGTRNIDFHPGNHDYLPSNDGYFTLIYEFRLAMNGGGIRKLTVSQDFKTVGGTPTLEGTIQQPSLTGVSTGLAAAFTIDSGYVRVGLTNTTGAAVSGHYWRWVLAGDRPVYAA